MISIIVPIYNVESYLPRCLDSLAKQNFPDVEFILIDDGATDRSSEIADLYRDDRFRVFHTLNRGLSAARNLGIEKSNGEWLMFVDSDDWVAPDFCKIPCEAVIKYDADLVIFRYCKVRYSGVINQCSSKRNVPVGVVDANTAIKYGSECIWNKLYRRELFETIRFPEGRVYEDTATTHKLIFSAKRIVMLPDVLYYYRYREDSISNINSAKNKRDCFLSVLERADFLKSHGCAEDLYANDILSSALLFLITADPSDDPVYQQAAGIVDLINGFPVEWSWKKKAMLLLWRKEKRLFHLICWAAGRRDSGQGKSLN